METVGSRIKKARENVGISQEQLGKMCGTTKQTIFKYETGVVTNIPMDRLAAIANALCVDPCALMGWNNCKKPSVLRTMPDLTADESDLLHKYRRLDDAAKGRIRHMVNYEYNSIPGSTANPAPKEA